MSYITPAQLKQVVQKVKDGLDKKANTDGVYDTMTVGTANEAISLATSVGVTDETPFAAQPVGGSSDVTTTYQKLNKLVACNVVKNQLVPENYTYAGSQVITNYKLHISNVTGNAWNPFTDPISWQAGHKYLLFPMNITNTLPTGSYLLLSSFPLSLTNPSIVTITTDDTNRLAVITATSTTSDNVYDAFVYCVDLTLRYGSNDVVNAVIGSDLSKYVEKLIAFDPNILKDTDYDTGSFSECKTAELLTIDYNQWDEEWEVGAFDTTTGANIPGITQIRSKNLIPVIGGKRYAAVTSVDSSGIWAMFYDAQGNVISLGTTGTQNNVNNVMRLTNLASTYSIPVNAVKMKFYVTSQYGSTYRHDISIFLYWDGSRIGYEPSKEHRYPMPNVAGHGILKVVNGKVVADGDVMTPDGSGNQTNWLEYAFTGSETWNLYSTTFFYIVLSTTAATQGALNSRCLCTNGLIVRTGSGGDTATVIRVYLSDNPQLTTESDIGSYFSNGTKLLYKLATPTTLTASTFTSTFYGDDFGTMWLLDEDGNVIDGLQGNEIFYKANVSGFAESMYIEADGDPEYFAAASQLTDTALNARGYYKMQDLSSEITDAAGLDYNFKKAYKIGNQVFITMRVKNSTGASISAGTVLFKLGASIRPQLAIYLMTNIDNTQLVPANVSSAGDVAIYTGLGVNSYATFALSYAIA